MYGTTLHDTPQPSRRVTFWAGTGLATVMVLGFAVLGRTEPTTLSTAFAIAGLAAAGTMAMAWLVQRGSEYPRWTWWATGGVMAFSLLASVAIAGSPVVWGEQVLPSAWLLPWFLLTMGISRAPRRDVCAAAGRRVGWIMVGTGMLLSAIVLGANPLVDACARIFAR